MGSTAEVELPAWIVPGQADNTVVVHLGYGRRAGGRAGTGVGTDVYPLRTTAHRLSSSPCCRSSCRWC